MLQAVFALIMCCSTCQWTIHGLWPQDGDWCHPSSLNKTALEPLVPTMKTEWPSCPKAFYADKTFYANGEIFSVDDKGPFFDLAAYDDWGFWSHEWSKHGSCTSMDQVAYFNYTLNLYSHYLSSLPTLCQPSTEACRINVEIQP